MKYLEISGGRPLFGEIQIQGSKNAALPILVSCILSEGTCRIENCPEIKDVEDTLQIMRELGCGVRRLGRTVYVDASCISRWEIRATEASRIRSSVLFLGALLGRTGKAVLPMPGGCAIGSRPVDLHQKALEQLGAVFLNQEQLQAECREIRGGRIRLPFPSVGATENCLLACVLAKGESRIENPAREPEIDELCSFLNCRGARISRRRDGSLRIQGVSRLEPGVWQIQADRIVAGTYLLAAACTGGSLCVHGCPEESLRAAAGVLRRMGAQVWNQEKRWAVAVKERLQGIPYVETRPYPDFPTDLQSPLMAAFSVAFGISRIRETIFENRFSTAWELRKMGAQIQVDGNLACIDGVRRLKGARLQAPDLRGGAALVLAGLQADGITRIERTEYIERGYEDICRDLGSVGARIRVVQDTGG